MGDFIVISVLCLIVGAILSGMRKNKKAGKSACGCDCGKCAKACPGRMNKA